MIEVLLGCFGVSVAGSWAWNLALGRKVDAQTAAIMQAVTVVENMQESSQLDVDGVMDEVQDVIHNTLGQMHTPTAADHLMGMVSTFMQHRLAAQAGLLPGPAAAEAPPRPGHWRWTPSPGSGHRVVLPRPE